MNLEMCLLDVDYFLEENKPVIRLWGKTSKGERLLLKDRSFVPYFYVEARSGVDLKTLAKRILDIEVEGMTPLLVTPITKTILGKEKELLKVEIQIPVDVSKFRDVIKEWKDVRTQYEHSVPFYKRYLIDKKLVPMGWVSVQEENGEIQAIEPLDKEEYPPLRVMAFDLELVEEQAGERIIMISFADTDGYKRVISYGKRSKIRGVDMVKGEKELLERFVAIVQERDPDILVGYNTDQFDFVKLVEKARLLGVPLKLGSEKTVTFERRGRTSAASITGRVHVDVFTFVSNILSTSLATEVMSLDRVARELIGKGKAPMDWKEIGRAWKRRDVKTIASYCQRDSNLTLELAEYLLPQIYELCRVTGQTLFDTSRMYYSQLVEWLYLRQAHAFGEVAPNRPKYDEIQRRRQVSYMGGYVHTPREGIHEKIAVFDFASLYPSITITHNISPETLGCSCCKGKNEVPEQGHHYCTQKQGFITRVLEDLVSKRSELKKKIKYVRIESAKKALENRQYALKILANASYGYYAYPGSRWYSKVCAESITALGRMYIKNVIRLAQDDGHWVIYGDTDSLFLRMNQNQIPEFLEKVNATLPGVMELDFKGFYPSGIFVLSKEGVAAKKRYALLDKKGKLLIRGFERVRRDWSAIAKDTQEQVLLTVLRDKNPEKAVRIVRQRIRQLQEGKVPLEDLIIYTQLTKPLQEYEQIGPHVRVAQKIIERGGQVRVGTTMSYIITKGQGSISERAEPADEAKEYDPEYYINNQVLPAAMRILAGLGYKEADFLQERGGQPTLKHYMKSGRG